MEGTLNPLERSQVNLGGAQVHENMLDNMQSNIYS